MLARWLVKRTKECKVLRLLRDNKLGKEFRLYVQWYSDGTDLYKVHCSTNSSSLQDVGSNGSP